MKRYWILSLLMLLPACVKTEITFSQYDLVDLTYSFSKETLYWPNAKNFQLEEEADGISDHGFYYSANRYSASEHGGTHLDAPVHFAAGQPSVDEIPLANLHGPAYLIDISAAAARDPDYLITRQDLLAWEMKHGQIPKGAVILLKTGFGQYWPQAIKYLGTSEKGPGAISKLHFPGLHPAAAQWLVDHRSPNLVGIDTASIDYGQSENFLSHQILAKAKIPIIENVANLDQVPHQGAWILALPMKITGGSGAPTRIVAFVPPGPATP